ncbi:TIGR00341 family protein [Photobacterium sp. GJ3]|uniref:TIGR00341 family protein n=1 Tax=Photobacterium sp. GJ3 TaxID=2829502 RepID=UPI001B8C1AEA|nr:TIGR00341 family protein [Photobacterium sp. GJ3]QUJ68963.1 TIGR00341 family protein [Photobacterium sp. GJ3]
MCALTESVHSETVMDQFERQFSSVEGFRLILFPIEASIPRTDTAEVKSDIPLDSTNPPKAAAMRISREELYEDIVYSTRLSTVFIAMTVLSTIVVAIGLLTDNVAVIIGAMVIAPFLGPSVALALATCLGDLELSKDATRTLGTGILTVVTLTALMGALLDVPAQSHEILTRTQPQFTDILLALASGCAGVLAFTTGASSTVIGVMVAVALLPPLSVFGLLLGAGHYHVAFGALLLFATNIICINLAGITTFLLQGVSPRMWWQADKAKKASRKALILWSSTLVLLAIVILFW